MTVGCKLVTEKFRYPHFFQSYVKVQFFRSSKGYSQIPQSRSSIRIHHLSCALRFRLIDGDIAQLYGLCCLPASGSPSFHVHVHTTVLQRPVPRPRAPFGASKLHSFKRPQSHEWTNTVHVDFGEKFKLNTTYIWDTGVSQRSPYKFT